MKPTIWQANTVQQFKDRFECELETLIKLEKIKSYVEEQVEKQQWRIEMVKKALKSALKEGK